MTRGTFYLITNEKLYSSTEFNGDMYPDGHGKVAKEMLEKVNSLKEFREMVKTFNKQEEFNYTEELVYENDLKVLDKYCDFNYKYFELGADFCWFSDWLFIKNISDKEYVFIYQNKEKETVKKGQLLISNFGDKPSKEDKNYLEGKI